MYGWRGRIGVIVPSVNTVIESEFHTLLPEGIGIYASRVKNAKATTEDLLKMTEFIDRAADELSSARVDLIAYGCTSGSFLKGKEWEKSLCEKISNSTGIPSITTSGAVISALKKLDAKSVIIATPYPSAINELEKKFIEENKISVLRIKGMNIMEAVEIGDVWPETTYRLVKEIFTSNAEGIFISCTNLRSIEIIEKLEKDFRVPVVTSNQATFWASVRMLGCRESIAGYGTLLSDY